MFKRSILTVFLVILTFTVMVSSLKLAGDALKEHQKSQNQHLGVRPKRTTLVIPGAEPRKENNGQVKKVQVQKEKGKKDEGKGKQNNPEEDYQTQDVNKSEQTFYNGQPRQRKEPNNSNRPVPQPNNSNRPVPQPNNSNRPVPQPNNSNRSVPQPNNSNRSVPPQLPHSNNSTRLASRLTIPPSFSTKVEVKHNSNTQTKKKQKISTTTPTKKKQKNKKGKQKKATKTTPKTVPLNQTSA